jgi:predicted RNase H-like nuclease (RuvC/YqgF family)
MSAFRQLLATPQRNAAKRPANPQWRTIQAEEAAKKPKPVPEQDAFNEQDSVASLRAQVAGLRTENRNLRAQCESLKDDVGQGLSNYDGLERINKTQERRHTRAIEAYRTNERTLTQHCIEYQRQLVAHDDKWMAKEAEVKRLQREFNDACNSLLAQEL